MTDFKEQPDTPGPQPRQGAKAFSVPVMENTEFSSKLPGFSSPVLASVVEEGSSLLPEADALSFAHLLDMLAADHDLTFGGRFETWW